MRIAFFDGIRSERLPANLLQAPRDYFGPHTCERAEKPRGEFFHTHGTGSAGVVYADGNLYFRYEDNVLALVEATPKGYHLRSTFQIGTGNPTCRERNSATNRELPGDLDTGWSHPVVVHGRLHIRGKNKVLCSDVQAKE